MRAIAGSFLALILLTGVASAADLTTLITDASTLASYCPPDYRGW